jgi:PhzF family phenazine biosynthesis protein
MRTVRLRHVDAFTSVPLAGNPAAVVDGGGLSPELMQRIALNQKLSETVFLLPPEAPDAHARLRIFTPGTEVPFAGHPTLAAAHVLAAERGLGGELRFETGAGVIPVRVGATSPRYTMTQAAPQFDEPRLTREQVAAALGLSAGDVVAVARVSTGLWWDLAQVATPEAMARVRPDLGALMQMPFGVSVFTIDEASDERVHVRTFAPAAGVPEDPVTGSSNGCIGAYIAHEGLLGPDADGAIHYIARQGVEMGQPGRVYVSVARAGEGMSVSVGGDAVTVLRGDLLLPDA